MLRLYSVKIGTVNKLEYKQITVSTDIMQQAKLSRGQQLLLKAGNRQTAVTVLGSHGSSAGTSVFLSPEVRNSLLLPTPLTLNLISAEKPGIWRLGPLIGIFANRGEKAVRPFGEQTGFFRKLKGAAEEFNSLVFAFCPDDIDWENKVIRGTIPPHPDSNNVWLTFLLPFPDAIYDRGLFPKGSKRRNASQTRKILRNYPGVKFFNPSFFGKWKTHNLLSKHEILQKYLPETRVFKSSTDVIELLKTHGTVFLKPSGGSSGRGIIRISTGLTAYSANYRTARKVRQLELEDVEKLNNYLKQFIGGTRYIVQQGLSLAKIHGCPFDIRVLMQKNRAGKWKRTGMAARVAGEGNYISNIHAGGHAEKLSYVLPLIFTDPKKVQQIKREINRVTSIIASWISTEENPLFGEIAIDLGVDDSGKVWVIELNAVPGRTVFRRIGATKIHSHAISRPMEFAYYLSGFSPSLNK